MKATGRAYGRSRWWAVLKVPSRSPDAARECVVCGQPLTPDGKCPRPQETACTMTDEGPEWTAQVCEHDWRLHKSRETMTYPPEPDPWTTSVALKRTATITTYDTWYCTKCRRIEDRVRV